MTAAITLHTTRPGQDGIRPARWEQDAIDAVTASLADNPPTTPNRLAAVAVAAIIDAGLAGHGGRCRQCGTGYPRTLPPDQDPLCWTCGSEEQTGLDTTAGATR